MKLHELLEKYGAYEITDLEKIKSLLERPKPKTVWDLEDGDTFYWIGVEVSERTWENSYEIFLEFRECGNVFLTYEEASKELDRRKVEALLKKYAGGYEFNPSKENFYIFFEYRGRGIGITFERYTKKPQVYFSSREDAERAVQKIGGKRLLRDYFQVEMEEQEDGK